ncbi:hypothetical protein A2331_02170 [Candidatus Falkowbacteria bacterium RIFOXYB2_FULL_34_18]|uniref:Ribose-phosphate pyrophosphokinase N-terminal domain-containing protein n=1 Tax=Candidatus Falkowbacteria bacterium RIFOXYD2_FULL_34_120 TaxID=1798007 RepID=A0A1F5TQU2_9BACT|nr:MAG: hypothetical protein A2331_02170 [Candidatus Falkowbacteria bacterium RIFOXYB2_FULL_34_18]OGF29525.1 MAG: hypothetical protein A2500_02360 [Candidatus Falkowbacteria bacterium RIFOXYC12_FULL_34_55]OGF36865.1 MAG: hypothetical protein A2466_06610 [Candidatus Falkowbacteria bacterium RIFOXYC2_FULL_34_220]OGF39064.1 MAG: hypothetical protein A2515_04615 [Candidatus Falkowbacteria bacterium RIFOXYD12_FULL_34_57]OGF41283.1 MAG: hypothetical protein A2531_00275 [Candidatus Falkowbacteria bact
MKIRTLKIKYKGEKAMFDWKKKFKEFIFSFLKEELDTLSEDELRLIRDSSDKILGNRLVHSPKPVLFYHHTYEKLAALIAEDDRIELGNIHWDKFSDKWPSLQIEDNENIRKKVKGRDVVFLASFLPENLFEQMAIIYALPRYQADSFRIVLPYFPVGTMERVGEGKEGEIATAMTMFRMLSATPQCHGKGPALLTIFDVHALQERFYPSDNIIPDLHSTVSLLKNRIRSMKNIAIVFPDDGARKRYGDYFRDYPIIVCNKVKIGKKKIITIKEGNSCGKHCIMVDDLIFTGGTLMECRDVLIKAGAKKISAYAAHGIFPEESWKKFTKELFEYVWITDSCPWMVDIVKDIKPFEILSIKDLIVNVITN